MGITFKHLAIVAPIPTLIANAFNPNFLIAITTAAHWLRSNLKGQFALRSDDLALDKGGNVRLASLHYNALRLYGTTARYFNRHAVVVEFGYVNHVRSFVAGRLGPRVVVK